mgnify:CR=1 FL=1
MSEDLTPPVINEQRKSPILPVILTVLLVILVSVSGFLAYQNHQLQQKIAQTSATLSFFPTIAPTAVPTVVTGQTVGWKTFNRNGMLFKYPQEWVINTSSDIISSRVPPITLVAVPKDRTLMNECMDMISTSMVSDVVVKKFARVSAGEMCTTDDTSSRQIWVVESEDSYSPGLFYQYSAQDSVSAEKIFDQILSTFKFLDKPSPTTSAQINGADLKDIKYKLSQDWEAKLNNDNLFISPVNGGGYLSIRVYGYPGNVGRREYYCQVSKVCIEGTSYFTEINIGNISGYTANALDNSGGGAEYFGAKGNKFYIISSYSPPSPNEFDQNYKNVLSSLVF